MFVCRPVDTLSVVGPSARVALGSAPLLVVACSQLWGIDDLTYDGGGTGGSATGGGETTTSSSSAGGAPGAGGAGGETTCDVPSDCLDGDPCTVGECLAGGCSQAAVPVGDPGTGEGNCEGTCQTDGACGLSLYQRAWSSDSPDPGEDFVSEPLSLAWVGDGAPPPRGILAAARAYQQDWLVVFSDADGGTTHVVGGAGTWLSAPTGALLPGLDGLIVNSATVYHGNADGPQTLFVTAQGSGADKLALFYQVDPAGSVQPDPDNPYVIEPSSDANAAAQDSVDADWELSVQTAFVGTPSWVVFWRSYEDLVYEVDGGNFSWAQHGLDVQSPIWGGNGVTGGPASGTTVAAYHGEGIVYLVAP